MERLRLAALNFEVGDASYGAVRSQVALLGVAELVVLGLLLRLDRLLVAALGDVV